MTTDLHTEAQIEEAWRKARPVPGHDPRLYRVAPDIIQSVIRRDRYDICGDYGWRIEHGKPVSYRNAAIEQTMKLMQYETYTPDRPAKTQIKQ